MQWGKNFSSFKFIWDYSFQVYWKLIGCIPRMQRMMFFTLTDPANSIRYNIPQLVHQPPPSLILGNLGRGPRHQSQVLEHRETYWQTHVCRKGQQGGSLGCSCLQSCCEQVLTYTESAISQYSITSWCLSALQGRLGRVKVVPNDLRWKKSNHWKHYPIRPLRSNGSDVFAGLIELPYVQLLQ